MAQDVSPEFIPQYCKKTKKEEQDERQQTL
jgi:hypothetical protein